MKENLDESRMVIEVTFGDWETASGEEETVTFPAAYAVCDRCNGHGSSVNPAVSVVTPEEFAEDPEFRDAYFRGDYDRDCPECKGKRVVMKITEPDESSPLYAAFKLYEERLIERARYARDCAAERRYLGM